MVISMAETKQIPQEIIDDLNLIGENIYLGDRLLIGSEIGRGYRQVKISGRRYLLHRLIFTKFYGCQPENIDHIDGNTKSNSPLNLRPATKSQNMTNRKCQSNSKSGRLGVDFMKNRGKWRVQIHVDGNKIYLGTYSCLLDAVAERIRAENLYHGSFSGSKRTS